LISKISIFTSFNILQKVLIPTKVKQPVLKPKVQKNVPLQNRDKKGDILKAKPNVHLFCAFSLWGILSRQAAHWAFSCLLCA
jgi:hypothetical protein